MNDKILMEDIVNIVEKGRIDFERFRNTSFLITGATGLIGYNIIKTLIYANEKMHLNMEIIALVRNLDKAKSMYNQSDKITFVVSDITGFTEYDEDIDYIIHTASMTSSKEFVDMPVETIDIALRGTNNLLNIAKEKKVKGFVYTSSMEIYGAPDSDEKIDEHHNTDLDTMLARSSYPESKRMCETMCAAYALEYGLNAKVARLTQTFGPGVQYDDGRVFAEFARCAVEKKDIVLHTKGETKRCYLYTADAVRALLLILLYGEQGEAYNVANEKTYCTIYDMANLVANECVNSEINVDVIPEDISRYGYAKTLHMNLDTSKIQKLGWIPVVDLKGSFERMITSWQ